MSKATTYPHPNPIQYQLEQWLSLGLLILLILAAIGILVLAIIIPAPLFAIMSPLLLLLAAPVLLTLVTTPPVQVEAEGLRLQPLFGGERFIVWEAIEEVVPYTLLPSANQEVLRQLMVGRKKYRAPEGIMLIIPSLPAPYRVTGFLSSRKGKAAVAFSNRSHADYHDLKHKIEAKLGIQIGEMA